MVRPELPQRARRTCQRPPAGCRALHADGAVVLAHRVVCAPGAVRARGGTTSSRIADAYRAMEFEAMPCDECLVVAYRASELRAGVCPPATHDIWASFAIIGTVRSVVIVGAARCARSCPAAPDRPPVTRDASVVADILPQRASLALYCPSAGRHRSDAALRAIVREVIVVKPRVARRALVRPPPARRTANALCACVICLVLPGRAFLARRRRPSASRYPMAAVQAVVAARVVLP